MSEAPSFQHARVMAGDAVLDVRIAGEGPTLVLLPALGRSASDLNKFACHLVAAGYRVVLPEPRGIGASSGRLDGLTLHDLARDVAAVVEAMCAEPAVLIGQLTIR